jgi:glycosyltransferase involved in cell wall biosynthesis
MFTGKPAFSIVTANYNNSQYLRQAVDSVLAQTTPAWELIIVDDHSTDTSLEVLREYTDPRIRVLEHSKNMGYTNALLTGIAEVRTPFFGLLDSDDALLPDAVSTMIDGHLQHKNAGYLYSQFIYCDADLKPYKTGYCTDIPKGKSNITIDGVSHFKTFKTKLYKKTTGFDPEIMFAQDKDISYKMEEIGDLVFINKILYLYRVLHNSQSHSYRKRQIGMLYIKKAKINALNRRLAFARQQVAEKWKFDELNPGNEKALDAYVRTYSMFPAFDLRSNHSVESSVAIVCKDKPSQVRVLIEERLAGDAHTEILVADCLPGGDVAYELFDLPVFYLKLPNNLPRVVCEKALARHARTKDISCLG